MSLRITAGKFKGRLLTLPSQQTTRPTSAKIRLAMFNIILHNPDWGLETLEDKIVFDGFAGSGSLGLESLSRGAKQIYFCESNPRVLADLHSNIQALGVQKHTDIFRCDVNRVPQAPHPADLVFLDPPYRKNLLNDALMRLQQFSWLHTQSLIVIEYAKDEDFVWPTGMKCVLKRPYGQTILDIGMLV